MIAAETAVLLGESGDIERARRAADQALAARARAPRFEQLSNCLRELARLQAQQEGVEGLADARAFLADAGRIADEARAAGSEAHGRSLDTALACGHGRVNAYAQAYEESLTALDRALGPLGEPGEDAEDAGEWAECVRLAGAVGGRYVKRPGPDPPRHGGDAPRRPGPHRGDRGPHLAGEPAARRRLSPAARNGGRVYGPPPLPYRPATAEQIRHRGPAATVTADP